MKLEGSFRSFLKDIVNLNDTRFQTAKDGIGVMKRFLQNDEVFGDYFISVTPQGSFRQETIIKPVDSKKEFDVDILFEMKKVDGWEPEDYPRKLAVQLRKLSRYEKKVDTKGKTRCVTIDYESDFHIDLVPAIDSGVGMVVMNKITNDFEPTDGDGYAEWFERQNAITGKKHLIKVIRLIKYLRDSKGEFDIKSIFLTTMIGNLVTNSDATVIQYSDLPTSLVTLLSRLDVYLQANPNVPVVKNPVLESENFNRNLPQEDYREFRDCIHRYSKLAADAYSEQDEVRSLELWQDLFGEDFAGPVMSQTLSTSKYVTSVRDFLDEYSSEEEDLQTKYGIQYSPSGHTFKIDTWIEQNGFMGNFLGKLLYLQREHRPVYRVVDSDITGTYSVMWKIKNSGNEAKSLGKLRGEIHKDQGYKKREGEKPLFSGVHRVECFAIKDGVCVAKDEMYIKIP
ncbi:MAG: nucleotidyltransferase [Candidatus Gracilibacteria bacterium]